MSDGATPLTGGSASVATRSARRPWLDAARGLFVVMMVAYHGVYIASMTGLSSVDLWRGFWWWFPRFIAAGFLFLSGFSLSLAATGKAGPLLPWLFRRAGKLALLAAAVSGVSALALGRSWVFFGILHCMAVGSVLLGPLLRRPFLSLASGAAVLAAGLALGSLRFGFWALAWLGFRPAGVYPADYLPLLPWFAWMLFGSALGALGGRRPEREGQLPVGEGQSPAGEGQSPGGVSAPAWPVRFGLKVLVWLGRHSLAIYLAHLPLLFAIFSAIAWLR